MNSQECLTLSWRIGVGSYAADPEFDILLQFVREYPDIVDELALFETVTHHLYLPTPVLRERAGLLARRMDALRDAGVLSVGINVLTTIGHINEGWDYMPALPFAPMVGHDGSVSKGCACPNTPEFREYVGAKYALMAGAGPDFIWVDDDIRMHNHGVAYGCFCSTCLRLFAESAGEEHTRASLVEALNRPDGGRLRAAWVEQNVRTLETLLADVVQAIHGVDPAIRTGLMTAGPGWTTYSGQAFERWFPALGATKARPGGGFYTDAQPAGMIPKALEVGRQRAALPPGVPDCQYELENFPWQALRKAAGSVVNECTLALACGLNGIAFNAIGWGDTLDDCRPIFPRVREIRPLWERLARHTEGLPTVGLWPACSHALAARRGVRAGEDWLAGDLRYDSKRGYLLAEIGLPLGVDRPACATVLAGRVAEGFSDAELREMLAGGLLLDGEALLVLEERGLGHLAGARVARRVDNGVMERLTGDALNGAHAGCLRDARIEFWGDARGQADLLEPAPETRVLATLENYFHETYGPCMTAHENALGGRVVVMGYAPWMFLQSVAKRAQLLSAADWVARGSLPVRIDEPVPLVPFVRLSPDRARGALVLLNAGLDPIECATLHVRAPEAPVCRATPAGVLPVETRPESGGWSLTLRQVAPWSTACLLWG